jgi:superfamily II DNA or RNA helicase
MPPKRFYKKTADKLVHTLDGYKGIMGEAKCPQNSTFSENFVAQQHQLNTVDYFLKTIKTYKGMLLFHHLGSGKTCTAIMIASKMLEDKQVERVFILSPGSLRQTWIKEYCKRCGISREEINKKYFFISYNAYTEKTLFFNKEQATDTKNDPIDISEAEIDEKKQKKMPKPYSNKISIFENSLVIIDEVHNMINSYANKSQTVVAVYNAIFIANCKVLALSGTPISKLENWPLLANLILGQNDSFNLDNQLANSLVKKGPSYGNGVLMANKVVINPDGSLSMSDASIINMLKGFISYHRPNEGYYPKIIHEPPFMCVMSSEQELYYYKRWEAENALLNEKSVKDSKDLYGHVEVVPDKLMEQLKVMARKRILSRSASNMYYPEEAYFKKHTKFTKDNIEENIEHELEELEEANDVEDQDNTNTNILTKKKLVEAMARNLKVESVIPKPMSTSEKLALLEEMALLPVKGEDGQDLKVVNKSEIAKLLSPIRPDLLKTDEHPEAWITTESLKNRKILTYSNKLYTLLGNIALHPHDKHAVHTYFKYHAGGQLIQSLLYKMGITSVLFSGDLDDADRGKMLENFNSEENIRGQKIRVFIFTTAGVEGISLKAVRHMHIFESNTNANIIQQAIGRGARYESHTDLPEGERTIRIWRYFSIFSSNDIVVEKMKDGKNITTTIDAKDKPLSIDVNLYQKGQFVLALNTSFLKLLEDSSVEKQQY